jgi:hypothetical protein
MQVGKFGGGKPNHGLDAVSLLTQDPILRRRPIGYIEKGLRYILQYLSTGKDVILIRQNFRLLFRNGRS